MSTVLLNGSGKKSNRLPALSETAANPENKEKIKSTVVTIKPPKFIIAQFTLVGTSPLMQARFSAKAMQAMAGKMTQGDTPAKGKKRAARDFDDDYNQAIHYSQEGWVGLPAAAIRCACIDVCRMTDFKMTHAKMSIFCEAEGYDRVDGIPLIKIHSVNGPEKTQMAVRNANGAADIRVRPLWREWSLMPRIRFDSDQFSLDDVTNLLARAGLQIGVGEGRAFSKESNGLGYGFWELRLGEIKVTSMRTSQ